MQRVTSTPDLAAIALPAIAVVDNLVRERLYTVSFTIPEFTCVCPMTGQPDLRPCGLPMSRIGALLS